MIYDTYDYLAMFFSAFFVVFLLGLQSKNANQSRYFAAIAAIVTSLGISIANFTFIKYAAAGTLEALTVSAIGGGMGIAGSIWFYDRLMRDKQKVSHD